MKKLTFAILVICSCLMYVACGGSEPITGSCPASDFNDSCCIRLSECDLVTSNPDKEVKILTDGCHDIDPLRKPLFCLPDFNTEYLKDCIPLMITEPNKNSTQKVEFCSGTGDIWNGSDSFQYNVLCCK